MLNSEVAERLLAASNTIERIAQLLTKHERAQSACTECSAILAECASEYAPPPPKPPDRARQHAAAIAARAKPGGEDDE